MIHGVRHLQLPQPNSKFVQPNGTIGANGQKEIEHCEVIAVAS
jgi:hypothetical protein